MQKISLEKLAGAAKRTGIFGRRIQVDAWLPENLKEFATKEIRKQDELEKEYRAICANFREIRLHSLWSTRIGEFISRCILAYINTEQNRAQGILDLFIMTDYKEVNNRLAKIIGRKINIIDEENVGWWKYVLTRFPRIEFKKYFMEYSDRKLDIVMDQSLISHLIEFTPEEEKEAAEKIKNMSLSLPYVCIASRDSEYVSRVESNYYNSFRNSNINNCALAVSYLFNQGIESVRMGKYVKDKLGFDYCIDYANEYYDEFMDTALPKFSKFFLTDSAGINLSAYTMGIPVALKNLAPLNGEGWGLTPQSEEGLFIFKKYFHTIKKRYLSVKEMLEVEGKGGDEIWDTSFYEKNSIEVQENTPEEILDLVKEMNERLDGTWVDTKEDLKLQEQFQQLLEEDRMRNNKMYNTCIHCKVSILFLKRNQFLMDD